jgi:hypothetical protein
VLASGLVSNLFSRDEQAEVVTELLPIMKRECPRIPPTPENAMAWFLERVKANLHVVLCFSPVGEKFRSRALKFPGLTSGRTAGLKIVKILLYIFPHFCVVYCHVMETAHICLHHSNVSSVFELTAS